ncbi:MAG: malonyl-ACP O-methyltransferase BioC [Betaproteobacteria bacterium]|nr:malonyl-ACP O-methyltransferase BioC [Betaproteobacteria bacterium]
MGNEYAVDKALVRRSFEQAAATYDAAAVLQDEVCRRMLARLDYIRLEPAVVLDAGSGTGNAAAGLLTRYPRARVVALDLALAMAQRARARRPWWRGVLDWHGPRLAAVCGDIEKLPLAEECVDMAWSNLAVQWTSEPQRAFSEIRRALKPGGVFMFSSFGPDTLKELRAAYQGVDRHTHVHRFIDMHDLGDMLVACGFGDPVMDMELITLTFPDVRALMRDLKAIGAHNMTRGRPTALSGKSLLEKVARNYEAFRRDGQLPATFEVVYGHAWKPRPAVTADGRPIIPLKVAR